MAFYLRRTFGDEPNVHVFHNVHFDREGERAQIDHLLLHRFGLIVVESKSCKGRLEINEHLEFTRIYGKQRRGMESPIAQAERQAELLRSWLIDRRVELRDRKLLNLVQSGFRHCPIQVLAAISVDAEITRPRGVDIPKVHKADQIPEVIRAYLARHKKGASLLTKDEPDWGIYRFSPGEMERLQRVFGEQSRETPQTPTPPPPNAPSESSPAEQIPAYVCAHCRSSRLEIRFGRSYYFKCLECGKNTPIKNQCRKCGSQTRTEKRKEQFFSVCENCDQSELFFLNASSST